MYWKRGDESREHIIMCTYEKLEEAEGDEWEGKVRKTVKLLENIDSKSES